MNIYQAIVSVILVLAGCGAMEPAGARSLAEQRAGSVLQLLGEHKEAEALARLWADLDIKPHHFAKLPTTHLYYDFFLRAPRFRSASAPQHLYLLQRFEAMQPVCNVLASDSTELKMTWYAFARRPWDTVSLVEVARCLYDLHLGLRAFNSIHAARQVDQAREVSEFTRLQRERTEEERAEQTRSEQVLYEEEQRQTATRERLWRERIERERRATEAARVEEERVRAEAARVEEEEARTEASRVEEEEARTEAARVEEEEARTEAARVEALAMYHQKVQALYRSAIFQRLPEWSITASRDSVFDVAYRLITPLSDVGLRRQVRMHFTDEIRSDLGGLGREFFSTVATRILTGRYVTKDGTTVDDDLKYFEPTMGNTYRVNMATTNARSLSLLKMYAFFGKFLGLAIINKQTLPATFAPGLFHAIMGEAVTLEDFKAVDLDYARALERLLEAPAGEVEYWGLVFVGSLAVNGVAKEVALLPNGENIDVTSANREDYVRRVVQLHMMHQVSSQLRLIRQGLFNVIPREYLSAFSAHELSLLVSGSPVIDVDDWEANTIYEDCNAETDMVVKFWDHVRNQMTDQDRSNFLLFATGSSRPPVTGFKDLMGNGALQRFTIHYISRDWQATPDPVIKSSTCFNRVYLPETSDEKFVWNMQLAIEHSVGFEMV